MDKKNEYGVSTSHFEEWRMPRMGTSNPTLTNNLVWEWLVKTKINAWKASQEFGLDTWGQGATWSFDRFGQSVTELPDGRKIYIGGEHEDYYDPDFFIYNDVVVEKADGSLDFYTYPKEVFPSTDFHSATLVGDKIFIIGCLGYSEQREVSQTPVFVLDTKSFIIERKFTSGFMPGWLSRHESKLQSDGTTLLISGGELYRRDELIMCENIDEWEFDTCGLKWTRKTSRQWPRWEYFRKEHKRNFLWEIRQAKWLESVQWISDLEKDLDRLQKELGYLPNLLLVDELYKPPVDFEELPEDEDTYGLVKISVDGVVVRYKESSREIQVIVEGELPNRVVETLKSDLLKKLGELVKTEWIIADI